jgi:hypothetical protein
MVTISDEQHLGHSGSLILVVAHDLFGSLAMITMDWLSCKLRVGLWPLTRTNTRTRLGWLQGSRSGRAAKRGRALKALSIMLP